MRMVLRDENRRLIGCIDVNAAMRPTKVDVPPDESGSAWRSALSAQRPGLGRLPKADRRPPISDSPPREAFLNWDTALDDAGHLRKCVACGCTDLYTEKAFPVVTSAVVVLAFVGAALGAAGLADTPPVLTGMAIVLALDVAILVFSRRRLVCYRCRTTYHDLPIARYHRPWDRAIADHYPARARRSDITTAIAASAPAEPVVLPTVTRTAPVAATDKGYFA